ncbi:hypothetical protein CHLRE_07g342000v5 [Chlamydomonas reinhardtii]|uniref:protein-L-isoaspartate(D-aspartate) O-methyltransferase n=1 Tax=Chlamydomonas reinhardtii TaxID=3055 RepID=A0A2K3DKN9_CHLRE|nr:uncharacterized protein CHLRE_07g342000v5 [Chlamydomonas reinhardtii]PNW81078.1 hypothetical protein CHLRE_07g342000v5 [Chlamydomonas reinhardtii]
MAAADDRRGLDSDTSEDEEAQEAPLRPGADSEDEEENAAPGQERRERVALFDFLRLLAHNRNERHGYRTNAELVAHLKADGNVQSDAVSRAMLCCPRDLFVPPPHRAEALADRPIRVEAAGFNISAPHVQSIALEALAVAPGEKVLDVGCGCGIVTAYLAHMVGPRGEVVGVDIRDAAVRLTAANLQRLRDADPEFCEAAPPPPAVRIERHNVFIPLARHRAAYDAVHVGGAVPYSRVGALLELLKPSGGRIVAPVASDFRLITKLPDGSVKHRILSQVAFTEMELPRDVEVVAALEAEKAEEARRVLVPASTYAADLAHLAAPGADLAAAQAAAEAAVAAAAAGGGGGGTAGTADGGSVPGCGAEASEPEPEAGAAGAAPAGAGRSPPRSRSRRSDPDLLHWAAATPPPELRAGGRAAAAAASAGAAVELSGSAASMEVSGLSGGGEGGAGGGGGGGQGGGGGGGAAAGTGAGGMEVDGATSAAPPVLKEQQQGGGGGGGGGEELAPAGPAEADADANAATTTTTGGGSGGGGAHVASFPTAHLYSYMAGVVASGGSSSTSNSSSGSSGSSSGSGALLALGAPDCWLSGPAGSGWRLPAHRAVLQARCELLRAHVCSGMRDCNTDDYQVPEAVERADAMEAFLHYLYKDCLPPGGVDSELMPQLLHAGTYFGCHRLVRLCEALLARELVAAGRRGGEPEVLAAAVAAAGPLLGLADEGGLDGLRGVALQFVLDHFPAVSASEGYRALPRPLVDAVAAEAVARYTGLLQQLERLACGSSSSGGGGSSSGGGGGGGAGGGGGGGGRGAGLVGRMGGGADSDEDGDGDGDDGGGAGQVRVVRWR